MSQAAPSTSELSEQAEVIAGEIFNLIHEYTNDSPISKFFLTDEVASACYTLAGGFAAVVYNPALEPEEIEDTEILSFLYALMTYGFNLYLKERSYLTNAAPYMLPTDKKLVKQTQKALLKQTAKGELATTELAEKVIGIITNNAKKQVLLEEFKIPKHRMTTKKFWEYAKLSLYWGYNFAKVLLEEKKTKKKPAKKLA